MTKASDNIFPKLILDEAGTLGTVAAGERRLGIDANGVLVWKNSAGTTSPLVALNKWDATTAPTANEDSGDGYQPGSRWIDTTNDKEYVCLDATLAAAVWTETTAAGGGGGSTPQGLTVVRTTQQNSAQHSQSVAVSWDDPPSREDLAGFWTNLNPTRMTAVNTGWHDFGCWTDWVSSTSAYRFLFARLNGVTMLAKEANDTTNVADMEMTLAWSEYLTAGDYIEFIFAHGVSGTYGISAARGFFIQR